MSAGGFPFVRSVHRVAEVDSTNDLARRLLEGEPLPLPLLVLADRQTRGRGQRSNAWWSDLGSLTSTIVLEPASFGLGIEKAPRVALATATAIVGAIARRHPACPASIRWPNDVEAGGRKLGGILAEWAESPVGPRLLVGVGLNIQARLDDAPAEVRRLAANLAEWPEADTTVDPREAILRAILDELPGVLQALAVDDPALVARWNRLDALAGSKIRVEIGPEIVEAVGAGIDESGGLRVFQNGLTRILHAGRVLRD